VAKQGEYNRVKKEKFAKIAEGVKEEKEKER